MTRIVSHYGIHWDEHGVAFLQQGRGGANALGLREKSPFEVRLPHRARHCNHMIPLAAPVPNDVHWTFFQGITDDPLVRAMLPIPKSGAGAYFLPDPADAHHTLLVMLSKLSSPIHNVVAPMWTLTPEVILAELQTTNVQPFVVTNVEPKHSGVVAQIAKAAVSQPRAVVFTGSPDTVLAPQVQRLTTRLAAPDYALNDLLALPWENLGAVVVRRYMRREWTA